MISSIIFSKDRALQLDLLLNSIYQNFKETVDDVRVIWTASSPAFETAYNQVKFEHRNVIFKKQTDSFFKDLYENVCVAHNKYICFFTDDDIVYRQVTFDATCEKALNDPAFVCYSLRLGTNTIHRDVDGQKYTDVLPMLYQYDNMITWNRTSIAQGGYWAYPFSVDGHIFRKQDLMHISELMMYWAKIEKFKENPNQLEAKMQRFNSEYGAMMLCDSFSSVVNTPNNRVQNEFQNRSGDHYCVSQDYCNNLYLSGKRIKMDDINFDNITKPHTELDILRGIK